MSRENPQSRKIKQILRFQIDNETLIQDMTEIKIITELKFSLEIAE